MHSHERTLISSLLGNDPDRKNPRHDLACRYLAVPEVAKRVVESLGFIGESGDGLVFDREFSHHFNGYGECTRLKSCDFVFEVHISKGEGKYLTTVGFIDVLMKLNMEWRIDYEIHKFKDGSFCSDPNFHKHRGLIQEKRSGKGFRPRIVAVEVKTTKVGVSDIIRQIKLYRTYLKAARWVLVTDFPISSFDKDMLDNERIAAFELGTSFSEWVERHGKDDRSGDNRAIVL